MGVEEGRPRKKAYLPGRAHSGNGRPREPPRPRRGEDQPDQKLEGGCLAGAVWTQKTQHFAGLYLQREVVEGTALLRLPETDWEVLCQSFDFDCRRSHGSIL